MKIPKTFISKKDTNNMEKLLKEKPEPPKIEQQPKELEEVLKLYDKERGTEPKINHLLEQNDYKQIERKKSFCRYYTKLSDVGEYRVFIKGWSWSRPRGARPEMRYGYAEVRPDKLEEFCKRFDTNTRSLINSPFSIPGILVGTTGGLGAAFLTDKIICYAVNGALPQKLVTEQTFILGLFGWMLGAFFGAAIYDIIRLRRNVRKLDECYTCLTLDDKPAIKEAFS